MKRSGSPARHNAQPFFYPAMNRIARSSSLVDTSKTPRRRWTEETIEAVRALMSSVPPDFWSVVGQTELDMYMSIAAGWLARDVERLIEDFGKHHARVNNERMWGSVFDNAVFVLSRYRKRAGLTEAKAVDRLLSGLGKLAVRAAPSVPGGSRGTRRDPSGPRPTGVKRVTKMKPHRRSRLVRRRGQ